MGFQAFLCGGGACGPASCHDASQNDLGGSCTTDADCGPRQECGPALFDFADRFAEDGLGNPVGPVLVSSTEYTVDAENPVPLEGLKDGIKES